MVELERRLLGRFCAHPRAFPGSDRRLLRIRILIGQQLHFLHERDLFFQEQKLALVVQINRPISRRNLLPRHTHNIAPRHRNIPIMQFSRIILQFPTPPVPILRESVPELHKKIRYLLRSMLLILLISNINGSIDNNNITWNQWKKVSEKELTTNCNK